MRSGRACAKVVEPVGLSVLREYEIPWKKQSYDIAKLARLRFEEGLPRQRHDTGIGRLAIKTRQPGASSNQGNCGQPAHPTQIGAECFR